MQIVIGFQNSGTYICIYRRTRDLVLNEILQNALGLVVVSDIYSISRLI